MNTILGLVKNEVRIHSNHGGNVHMAVTRCVCYQRTFRDIQAQAKAHGWTTTAEISLHLRCGLGCGGCRPYLDAMLDTGATCFAVRTDDQPPKPCKPEPWDVQ